MGEIKLNAINISNAIDEMDDLVNCTKNYSATLSFKDSKGDTIESLVKLAADLEGIRDAFVATCIATRDALQKSSDTFCETDNALGDYFDGKEDN